MADEDKLINVVIKFSQQGAQDVSRTEEQLRQAIQQDVTRAQQMTADYAKTGKINAQEMDAITARLTQNMALYQTNFSKNAQQNVVDTKKFNASLEETESQFRSLRMSARELGQIGTFLTLTGGLIVGGLAADAANYVKTVGVINSTSAEWLGYEGQIKQANLEIGQTAAQAILPTMKTSAQIMSDIAAIAKANPWIIQGAVAGGSTLLALGVTTKVIAELAKVVADVGLLVTKTLGKTVAGGAAGGVGGAGEAAAAGSIFPVIGAVIAGAALQFYLLQGEIALSIAGFRGLMSVLGLSQSEFMKFYEHMVNVFHNLPVIGALFPAGQAAAPVAPQITQSEVQAFVDFQKQIQQATQQYESQRADTIKSYEQQVLDITQQYEAQRASVIANFEQQQAREARDFAEQQSIALRDFNEQQAKAYRDYQEQVQKAERSFQIQQRFAAQQHALEMARLEADHNARMTDLAQARDALGLVKEQQSYQQQRTQKEQDYQLQRAQAREQLQIQLADMKRNFEQQRADALAAFQQQQADAQAAYQQRVADQTADEQARLAQMDADHKIEMEKLAQQEKDKLAKMDDAYAKQIQQIQTAFIDRLRALDSALLGDTAAFTQWMEAEAQAFQTWLSNYQLQVSGQYGPPAPVPSPQPPNPVLPGPSPSPNPVPPSPGPKPPKYQSGGYAQFVGAGEDGMPEYVLSNPTTRALEAAMGGRLTQANLLSAVLASRNAQWSGGGRSLQIVVQSRSLTMSQIRSEIDSAFDQKLGDLLPAFGVGNG